MHAWPGQRFQLPLVAFDHLDQPTTTNARFSLANEVVFTHPWVFVLAHVHLLMADLGMTFYAIQFIRGYLHLT